MAKQKNGFRLWRELVDSVLSRRTGGLDDVYKPGPYENMRKAINEYNADVANKKDGLRECPFCGGKAELALIDRFDCNIRYTEARAVCTVCRCGTKSFLVDGYYGSTETVYDAIKAWNKRVTE